MSKEKRMRGLLILLACMAMALALTACGGNDSSEHETSSQIVLSDCQVSHELEFGGIYIHKTIDEFNELGFEYGDSVDISFDNGFEVTDIPYYNGYYTQLGEPLLVAYPGYPYIRAGINSGDDLWKIADLKEDSLATVTLHERGKYLAIQDARDLEYTDDRDDYDSDKIFANFRSIKAGKLKKKLVYRSASPSDNQHGRAHYVDDLIKKAGVKRIINLAEDRKDLQADIKADDFDSPHFLSLYQAGRVFPLAMQANYDADEFRHKAAKGMKKILAGKGPYLVHCTEGKDRTGFMCMLIAALCDASYEEIVSDYMITYDNYYGISQESDPEKYQIIVSDVLDPMIRIMVGNKNVNIRNANLSKYAEKYLKSGGMETRDIQRLKDKLTRGADQTKN